MDLYWKHKTSPGEYIMLNQFIKHQSFKHYATGPNRSIMNIKTEHDKFMFRMQEIVDFKAEIEHQINNWDKRQGLLHSDLCAAGITDKFNCHKCGPNIG